MPPPPLAAVDVSGARPWATDGKRHLVGEHGADAHVGERACEAGRCAPLPPAATGSTPGVRGGVCVGEANVATWVEAAAAALGGGSAIGRKASGKQRRAPPRSHAFPSQSSLQLGWTASSERRLSTA
eukprot:1054968-Prymnesium_polylepis.1